MFVKKVGTFFLKWSWGTNWTLLFLQLTPISDILYCIMKKIEIFRQLFGLATISEFKNEQFPWKFRSRTKDIWFLSIMGSNNRLMEI